MLVKSNNFNLFVDVKGFTYSLHETHKNGLGMVYAVYQSTQYKNLFCVMGYNSKEMLFVDRSHENCIDWIYCIEEI